MQTATAVKPSVEAFLKTHQIIKMMPDAAMRILRATRDPQLDTEQLLKLVERDAAIAARIIKTVNSTFYSPQSKITRLDRAIAFMGLKATKELAASASLSMLCPDVKIGAYSGRDLLDHSLGVAILSRELAVRSKTIDPEDAFAFGMLHDVGLLLSSQAELEKTTQLFRAGESRTVLFSDLEQRLFGFDHCELGAQIAESWKFASDVTAVIEWHHRPEEAPVEWRAACSHVFIADTLCTEVAMGLPLTCALQKVTDAALADAGLSRQDATDVTAKLKILIRLHQC